MLLEIVQQTQENAFSALSPSVQITIVICSFLAFAVFFISISDSWGKIFGRDDE
jgi:hypothetical protein